nr:membrane metallo-endopeptidase-like 1 [Dermacentor andersoni]
MATRVDAPELEKTDNVKEGVVCAVVVLVLAGVLTAVGLYMSFWPSDMDGDNSGSSVAARNDPLCQGSRCADATARLKAIMKTDADPCENFYRFVCGNYESPSRQMLAQMEDEMYASLAKTLEKAKLPPSEQTAPEKAAALYKACSMGVRKGEVDDSAFMKQFMEHVGLTANTYASAEPLDKMVMLFFRYNLGSVLDLSLVDTRVHRGHRVLRVGLSAAHLWWLGNRGRADANSFYRRHLGPFGLDPKSALARDAAGEIINAETVAIAELIGRSNPGEGFGEFIYMVSELNHLAPCETGNWENLISRYSSHVYGADDEVMVQKPDIVRFANLCRYLGRARLSLLVSWELLRTLMPLSSPGVAMHYKDEMASHMCLRAVARAMEVPLLSWYLFKEVPPGAVAKAKEMADYIRKSILEEIDSSTWLDGTTKRTAINKVYSMRLHVGYPSHFASREDIERFYSSYPDVEDRFLQPWQEAMKKTVQWMTIDNSSFW